MRYNIIGANLISILGENYLRNWFILPPPEYCVPCRKYYFSSRDCKYCNGKCIIQENFVHTDTIKYQRKSITATNVGECSATLDSDAIFQKCTLCPLCKYGIWNGSIWRALQLGGFRTVNMRACVVITGILRPQVLRV